VGIELFPWKVATNSLATQNELSRELSRWFHNPRQQKPNENKRLNLYPRRMEPAGQFAKTLDHLSELSRRFHPDLVI
jgi:hypothetical protein